MPAAQKSKPAAANPVAAKPVQQGDHVFLVDGSGYIFRAYHALPPINRKSDGLQLNAVFGFCNMLWKLLRDMKPEERPTHLAVIFDKSEKTFRTDMYPDYKAHRPDPPDDLKPQFKFIREAVQAFDLPCLEQDGFEADDLIATYVRQASEAGATATIVSSDKDLMQLVGDRVVMFDTMKDKKIGRAEVMEKFGVPPEKVIEVQALIGDSTDNVPGVPGIGVKTAAQLIGEYGDLETLLARAGEIKQEKRRQTLIDNADKARLSKQLVTLDDHVALAVPIGDLAVHEPDNKRLIAFLKAMEFNGLMRRVGEYAGIDPGNIDAEAKFAGHAASFPPPLAGEAGTRSAPGEGQSATPQLPLDRPPQPADIARKGRGEVLAYPSLTPAGLAAARVEAARNAKFDRAKYETVRSLERLNAWIERARELGFLAIDAATVGTDPMRAELCGLALAVAPNEACYVPLGHRQGGEGEAGGLFGGDLAPDQLSERAALDALQPLFEDQGVIKIGHDLKFAWQLLALRGVAMAGHDDTMLMSYALDAGRASHALPSLAEHTFNHAALDLATLIKPGKTKITFDAVGIEQATTYGAERADIVLRLWQVLKARLPAERVLTVYETLERPLVPVLARMERRGISIDRNVLSRLSGEFAQEAAGLEAEINKEAGETVNPGSPKQLGDILFGKLGLPGGTKTKTGQWATGARALEDLAEQGHALPQKILDWRQVSKLKSTYTDALPGFVNPTTHRVHTNYALASTTTGRLSSSDPNLQNIPVRTEDGRKIRRAFIAAPGMKLVSADYSQIELRLLGRDRRHRTPAKSLPRRSRHSRHDGVGNVRRAGQGHAAGHPPPRQGDQFRHRLRHLRLRPRQSARHPARGSRRLHQEILRALPRHPRLHRAVEGLRQEERLCADPVRPQMPLSGNPRLQRLDPRLQRARRHQRPPAGLRRRHHPPRHGPHGGRAGAAETLRADAVAGARRTGVRGARRRSGKNAAGGEEGDGRRAAAGAVAVSAASGRGACGG